MLAVILNIQKASSGVFILSPKETVVTGGMWGTKASLPCFDSSRKLAIVSKCEEEKWGWEEAEGVFKLSYQETNSLPSRPQTFLMTIEALKGLALFNPCRSADLVSWFYRDWLLRDLWTLPKDDKLSPESHSRVRGPASKLTGPMLETRKSGWARTSSHYEALWLPGEFWSSLLLGVCLLPPMMGPACPHPPHHKPKLYISQASSLSCSYQYAWSPICPKAHL